LVFVDGKKRINCKVESVYQVGVLGNEAGATFDVNSPNPDMAPHSFFCLERATAA
jgi:hypothetical protein